MSLQRLHVVRDRVADGGGLARRRLQKGCRLTLVRGDLLEEAVLLLESRLEARRHGVLGAQLGAPRDGGGRLERRLSAADLLLEGDHPAEQGGPGRRDGCAPGGVGGRCRQHPTDGGRLRQPWRGERLRRGDGHEAGEDPQGHRDQHPGPGEAAAVTASRADGAENDQDCDAQAPQDRRHRGRRGDDGRRGAHEPAGRKGGVDVEVLERGLLDPDVGGRPQEPEQGTQHRGLHLRRRRRAARGVSRAGEPQAFG